MAKKYLNLYLETSGMPIHAKIKEAYDSVGHLEDLFYNNIVKLLDI